MQLCWAHSLRGRVRRRFLRSGVPTASAEARRREGGVDAVHSIALLSGFGSGLHLVVLLVSPLSSGLDFVVVSAFGSSLHLDSDLDSGLVFVSHLTSARGNSAVGSGSALAAATTTSTSAAVTSHSVGSELEPAAH